jgi:NAD-dependent deacetylase
MASVHELVQKAAECLNISRHAIALTGAGISTESGISDFRGPDGLWTKHPEIERIAHETYFAFLRDPREYWELRLRQPYMLGNIEDARPNPGHFAIAEMEQMGVIKAVLTQNIDGLHEKAGTKRVLNYHGSVNWLRCSACGKRYKKGDYDLKALLKEDKLPPVCTECQGAIKEDIVHFNEPIPADVAKESTEEATKCDLMLICGTSAVVYPFASLPQVARERERNSRMYGDNEKLTIIEVNGEPTQLTRSHISDFIIEGKTAAILPAVLEGIKALRGT